MIRLSKVLLTAGVLLATAGPALAQDASPPPDEPPAAKPAEEPKPGPGAPPLTLYKGKLLIAGETVNFNLSTDAVAKPISLAPSVWYGVSDKLTLGLTHDFGTTPLTPRPVFRTASVTVLGVTTTYAAGTGICLTGEDNGCPKVYDNLGVDALYGMKQERLSVAVHPALDIASFDPFALDLRLGVLGRYLVNNKLAIVFDPRLQFGITERDSGNKEAIDIPVWAWYEINDKIAAYLGTGLNGRFEKFGDNYSIPLLIGANYKVSYKLTAGLDFGFLRLNDGADARALGLRVVYAL
jgi:opacity protein-like surface antigen